MKKERKRRTKRNKSKAALKHSGNSRISFGIRRINQMNYSFSITLPKIMLQNIGLNANDSIEFIMQDGICQLVPIKAVTTNNDKEKEQEKQAEKATAV